MLKAHQLLKKGIERELDEIEVKLREEMLKNNFESSLPSMSRYDRCKMLMDYLMDSGYDLKLIQYEGGIWDGEIQINKISWKNAEPDRKGEIIETLKYKQKKGSTQYMEVKS